MEKNKKELRLLYSNKRKGINKNKLDIKITNNTLDLINEIVDNNKEFKIHIFLPISKKNEINTFFIINKLKLKNIKFYISKSNFETNELTNFELTENTELKENKYGIPEPLNALEYKKNEYNIIIVPLLCSDINGYRVGYGKGFYDRFLSNLKQNYITIGLNYFEPIKKITDTNKYDIRLNYLITSEKIYRY